jgi:hypothetical protein
MIGSPFVHVEKKTPWINEETRRLYFCAVRNRMPLLYLDALRNRRELEEKFRNIHGEIYQRYLKTYDVILEASNILKKASIKYAVFKTIRPYLSATVDVDILIFGGEKEYRQSLGAFLEAGYEKRGSGPNSTTFRALKTNMGIDLYREVAVSHIIYLDKDKLYNHVISWKIFKNGEKINTLSPIADLIAIIAHSLIKEHLYTISEYYSTLNFIKEMHESEILNFIVLVKENAATNAVKTHLGITTCLHKKAHGEIPEKLKKIINKIGLDLFEGLRLKEANFKTPHRFHILTIAKALSEKMKEEKAKRSMAKQFRSMMQPSFTKFVIKGLLNHIKRETY